MGRLNYKKQVRKSTTDNAQNTLKGLLVALQQDTNVIAKCNKINYVKHIMIHVSIHSCTFTHRRRSHSQHVRSSQGEASCSGTPLHSREVPGIELTTFLLPANLLTCSPSCHSVDYTVAIVCIYYTHFT